MYSIYHKFSWSFNPFRFYPHLAAHETKVKLFQKPLLAFCYFLCPIIITVALRGLCHLNINTFIVFWGNSGNDSCCLAQGHWK